MPRNWSASASVQSTRVESRPLCGVLGQLPGRGRIDVAVQRADEFPDGAERLLEREVRHLALDPRVRACAASAWTCWSSAVAGPGRPSRMAPNLDDQGRRPAREVAEVVGEVGVETADEGLLAEVGVEAEGHLAQEEVAEGVVAVLVRELKGLDDVADRLGHLPAAERPVAVDVQAPVERDPGRVEHGGPVDAVRLEDVLADQVLDVGPELLVERAVGVAESREVVDQRVEPDVGDVLVVEGQRDAPREPRLRPADGEVLERLAQEAQHLVAVALGLDEARVVLEVLDQPVLVLRHLEEVVLLLDEGAAPSGGRGTCRPRSPSRCRSARSRSSTSRRTRRSRSRRRRRASGGWPGRPPCGAARSCG